MTRQSALLDRLMSDGRLTPDQYEGVSHHIRQTGASVEEALLETSAFNESDLLKHLAKLYGTRFVTTEKLAKADIDQSTLALVPRKLAEKLQVFPVVYDAASGTLSAVTPDPTEMNLAQQVKMAGNLREVKLYVARPAAIKAAILKHYGGDIHAFSHIDRQNSDQYKSLMSVFDRNLISDESLAQSTLQKSERNKERTLGAKDLERADKRAAASGPSGGGVSTEDYLETLTVLVSLLENGRGELRGHSALVARLVRKLCERIGLSAYDTSAYVCAALLHDIGKSGTYHLTSLNVSEYEGHRVAAQKALQAPLRLFESVRLFEGTESSLRALYERADGQGFPEGLTGKEIPLGARMLALCETYADLTQNSRNPYRKKLAPQEACEALARYKGRVFDANMVDLFKLTVLGDDLRVRLMADRPVVLLIESDPEESTVLELRLLEQGYDVQCARTPDAALQLLGNGHVAVCISETELSGGSGFDLLARVRQTQAISKVPWLFVSRDGRRESIARAYEMNVADYLIKPVHTDVLVAKVRVLFEQGQTTGTARGVSGSLSEMGLPDIVQVLAQSRKTGRLRIQEGADVGEIHFDQGQVVNAMHGRSRGADAFYAMCGLVQGDFVFDPTFKPGARVMEESPEMLLLEGMRRMDEGQKG